MYSVYKFNYFTKILESSYNTARKQPQPKPSSVHDSTKTRTYSGPNEPETEILTESAQWCWRRSFPVWGRPLDRRWSDASARRGSLKRQSLLLFRKQGAHLNVLNHHNSLASIRLFSNWPACKESFHGPNQPHAMLCNEPLKARETESLCWRSTLNSWLADDTETHCFVHLFNAFFAGPEFLRREQTRLHTLDLFFIAH